jgi:hypothetical protein
MNAIEQLKSVLCDPTGKCCIKGSEEDRAIVDRALEALTQPEQKPMHPEMRKMWEDHFDKCFRDDQFDKCFRAQPEQEPVAWKEIDEVECPVCKDKGFPWPKCGHITYLEPTPPQRTWVGLTDGVMCDIAIKHGLMSIDWIDFARAIEQALKEKNFD